MEKELDVLLRTEDRPEIDGYTEFLKSISEAKQNKMLFFLEGVKFAEMLSTQPTMD